MVTIYGGFGGYQFGWQSRKRRRTQVLPDSPVLAFFAIYVLWGTTFLAIRIAVEELPPALRRRCALLHRRRAALCLHARQGRSPADTAIQWRSLTIMALLMFVAEYGPLFWAEKYVPSGVVSVLAATLPILTMIIEMLILRQHRMRPMVVLAVLIGFAESASSSSPAAASTWPSCHASPFLPEPQPGRLAQSSRAPCRFPNRDPPPRAQP